ncbi:hypothetical protein I3842_03G148500 [Carya illinoinensis]|uniref:Uncharacterized protein n=1 Tax=Carya illinoinensis TaxID=32201 RepID=A0A922JVV2_CARIL|nr:hypothetical protein I3842_03G148500 [Carya illinoinensis]
MPSPLFAFTSHLSLTSSSSGWYQLSGICGSDTVGLWSRFLRLHLSQYVYIYIIMLCICRRFYCVLMKPMRISLF